MSVSKGAGMPIELFAPAAYWDLGADEKATICNGMGAKDSLVSYFIPNTVYGLDLTEAGNIHDYMYHVGWTVEDKRRADEVFLNNMMRIVNHQGGWLAPLRRRRAVLYYEAVLYAGGPAFWSGKNKPEEFQSVGTL